MSGLGRYFELTLRCKGQADPRTGYFLNITHLDNAARAHALPMLAQALEVEAATGQPAPLGRLIQRLAENLDEPLDHALGSLSLQLTPMVSLTIETQDMAHVILHQRYEFAAAHRLHVPEYSEERNRDIFGKCNNPAGHGHNYTLEVAVRCEVDARGHTADVAALDAAVDEHVIRKLDHKHLNVDVPEFRERNPSVEHIAVTCWQYLVDHLPGGTALKEVTVWETPKTACTYRGE
jgi:6-pyruvoyltetrahydropterin/6-carboxytetrahydropterin synthase